MSHAASLDPALRRVRQGSEMAALRALHRFGRLSRADLARVLGLNRSSSGHIVAALTAEGLVREVADAPDGAERAAKGRAGRPGILLELQPDAVFFAGVEIGVEHISFVAIDLSGTIVAQRIAAFDAPAAGLDDAFETAARLAADALPTDGWARCEGFGIAIPAQMERGGRVRVAPLLGWRDVHPAALMRAHLPDNVPVAAENDANAFAIGDAYGRDAARPGVTLALVLETGVGGGILVDGALFRGGHGLAGEIGHLLVPAGDGAWRRLEELVGLEGVLSAWRASAPDGAATLEAFLSEVQDRAPGAVAIAEGWARALAFGLSQGCRLVDPDQIVLGGSLAALYPLVGARVAAHWARIQDPGFPMPGIVVNADPTFGAAFGAACILHQRFLAADAEPAHV
ncbi:ROK family transcriptional regulator [Aureimonas sp. Leaf324]|uniref:ROK family transcriptional regulator n=1 Tax=Aureimonas sp. Leaf324 TaxID=1736336 RepID=UPI0006F60360|nr:ROK family transcriptional regulator [Aureimonas sp. Leaf324]KQQ80774.1 ROK family transcriptional regulator [Aureimonas sp. Leaf324]